MLHWGLNHSPCCWIRRGQGFFWRIFLFFSFCNCRTLSIILSFQGRGRCLLRHFRKMLSHLSYLLENLNLIRTWEGRCAQPTRCELNSSASSCLMYLVLEICVVWTSLYSYPHPAFGFHNEIKYQFFVVCQLLLLLLLFLLFYRDWVSLYSPRWSTTHCVDKLASGSQISIYLCLLSSRSKGIYHHARPICLLRENQEVGMLKYF